MKPFILEKEMDLALVVLCGRQGNVLDQLGRITNMGKKLGATEVHILRPPSNSTQTGWHKVVDPTSFANKGLATFAEGGVLPGAGHCVMIPTRDCPVVYVENLANGKVGAVHAGRESLIKRSSSCGNENVIQSLMHRLEVVDGEKVNAYITGGISAQHFPHDDPELTRPFVERYGSEALVDQVNLKLDLNHVIRAILFGWGVPERNVVYDGLCSFKHPGLGSRRADRPEQNWVFIHQF